MNTKTILKTATLGTIAALLTVSAAAAAQQKACIPFDDIQQIHMVSGDTAIVSTRRDQYEVKFRGYCQVKGTGGFFIVNRDQTGPCLGAGQTLDTSLGVPCPVQSVMMLQNVPIKGSQK